MLRTYLLLLFALHASVTHAPQARNQATVATKRDACLLYTLVLMHSVSTTGRFCMCRPDGACSCCCSGCCVLWDCSQAVLQEGQQPNCFLTSLQSTVCRPYSHQTRSLSRVICQRFLSKPYSNLDVKLHCLTSLPCLVSLTSSLLHGRVGISPAAWWTSGHRAACRTALRQTSIRPFHTDIVGASQHK